MIVLFFPLENKTKNCGAENKKTVPDENWIFFPERETE